MKKILSIIALGSMSLLTACKDKTPAPELPPYTETGENTFGCYVDGLPYAIFEGTPGGFSGTKTTFDDYFSSGSLRFNCQNESPLWSLAINILNPEYKVGIYKTNGYPGANVYYSLFISDGMPSGGSIYESSPDTYITVDLKKAIKRSHYAGTFEGELVNGDGKIIKITEGRFDIKK